MPLYSFAASPVAAPQVPATVVVACPPRFPRLCKEARCLQREHKVVFDVWDFAVRVQFYPNIITLPSAQITRTTNLSSIQAESGPMDTLCRRVTTNLCPLSCRTSRALRCISLAWIRERIAVLLFPVNDTTYALEMGRLSAAEFFQACGGY